MEQEIEPKQARMGVRRISISLPELIFRQLDRLVDRRGFRSRSQAISEMISSNLVESDTGASDALVAGSLTVFYRADQGSVRKAMARLQQVHMSEVVSSLSVQLEEEHAVEVLMLRGTASQLKSIENEFVTLKGVLTGKLVMVSQAIPPPPAISGSDLPEDR